jgi:acyl carrier protein
MELRNRVVNILKTLFFTDKPFDMADDDSLMKGGNVDSLGMMQLVSTVEEEFGIKVDLDDLIPENFDSINALIKYINSIS